MAQDVGAFVGAVALCGFVGPASLAPGMGQVKERRSTLKAFTQQPQTD